MPSFNSFEALTKHLNQKLNAETTVDELFSKEFMSTHTKFSTLKDFLLAGGYSYETQDELDKLLTSMLDTYIVVNTEFTSMEEFKKAAKIAQIKRVL